MSSSPSELERPAGLRFVVPPRSRPSLITRHGLVDEVLGAHEQAIGRDLAGYRGHVYRTLNFAWAQADYPGDTLGLVVAASFHDLGIWTDLTFDYLEPSARRAVAYVEAHELAVDTRALRRVLDSHHKLSRCAGDPQAEAFRRADLIDLSWGFLRFGLPRALVAEVQAAFPNAGFHRCLGRVGLRWARAHPLRPLPMLRW